MRGIISGCPASRSPSRTWKRTKTDEAKTCARQKAPEPADAGPGAFCPQKKNTNKGEDSELFRPEDGVNGLAVGVPQVGAQDLGIGGASLTM